MLVGDNSFYPQEIRVTLGSTAEWDYNGGGGETESIHNIVASKELLLRRPEPGSRLCVRVQAARRVRLRIHLPHQAPDEDPECGRQSDRDQRPGLPSPRKQDGDHHKR